MTIRVLVVEDEAVAAEAHAAYVARTPGFETAAVARSAAEALRALDADRRIDLVLLDFHLPDGHGLGLVQRLRATGHLCDIIAVTSARDVEVVRQAVAQGVVLYLLKPFSYAGFQAKLQQYADYRARLAASATDVAQGEVDELIGTLRPRSEAPPKGLSAESLHQVTDVLRRAGSGRSASEVAETLGFSRVTARRYLEHLADAGVAVRAQRYRRTGRPEVEYRWRPTGGPGQARSSPG
jgi:response regulator of citrate/malate metabolism